MWDQGTEIYVTLSADYRGKVCGQCGDFNMDSSNDLRTRQGEVANAIVAGHSWRTDPDCQFPKPLTDPCESFDNAKRVWAQKQCGIITSEAFSTCHDLVSVPVTLVSGKCALIVE